MSLNYDFEAHLEDRPIYKMSVYTEREGYVLIGSDRKKAVYSILRLKKINFQSQTTQVSLSGIINEDPELKTEEQISAYLKSRGDQIKLLCKACAILGFIKFLQGYYIMLVTEANAIAKIGNQKIFKVNSVKYISLFDSSTLSKTKSKENKYLQYLKSFDLSTGFYFSDTYDLTNTFQTNVVSLINDHKDDFSSRPYKSTQCDPIKTYNDYFMWNYYVIEEFYRSLRNKRWVTAFLYGYIEQIKIQKLVSLYQIILIARRSRHHAGTRYLTRGLNPFGFVGNFVETEQIVIDLNKGALGNPVCSSFVQVRGSAPIYWFQETKVVSPKPPINVNPSADIYFEATKKHFADLYSLYGPNIFALNLVKKKEGTKREGYLTEGFQQSIDHINLHVPKDLKIIYYHQDMKALLKKDKEEFLNVTTSFGLVCLSKIGFFCASMAKHGEKPTPLTFQTGVIRSNCVDCLDRTNTFQQLLGEAALSLQIAKTQECVGKESNSEPSLDDTVLKYFKEMYGRMGDIISLQYGGSIAHKTNFGYHNAPKQIEFLTSLKRYYSNTFTDQHKQGAINLFLGIHRPNINESPVWETTMPIIWRPDLDVINQSVGSQNWWKYPIETFFMSISINNDPEALNKALNQPPVVKIDPNNSYVETFQEDFSMHLSLSRRPSILDNFDAMSIKSSQRHDLKLEKIWNFPEGDLAWEVSKNVNFTSDIERLSNSMAYVMPPSPSDLRVPLLTKKNPHDYNKYTALSDIDNDNFINFEKKFFMSPRLDHNEKPFEIPKGFKKQKCLTSMSKKLKKIYNHILVVDEKYDEIEEYSHKDKGDTEKGERQIVESYMFMKRNPYPEDDARYEEYCSFTKKNTDDMFNDEEMKKELQQEMKLGFEFDQIHGQFNEYLDITKLNSVKEEFPNRIIDYISPEPVKEIAERVNKITSQKIVEIVQKGAAIKGSTDDPQILSKRIYNLGNLKNILTSIYPNLQKPNITKA